MKANPTLSAILTDPEEQVDFLIAYWEKHGNLDGIYLPEGSDPRNLSLRMILRGMMRKD